MNLTKLKRLCDDADLKLPESHESSWFDLSQRRDAAQLELPNFLVDHARQILSMLEVSDALSEELYNMATQHKCGCKHPACNRCGDDERNESALAAWKKAKGEDV